MSEVMNSDNKILYVLGLIEVAAKLSAKDSPCVVDHKAIDMKQLNELELQSILEKLEDEKIIEIRQNPYDMWPDVGTENEPDCYKIKVLNGFEGYYNELYKKANFGINNLDTTNHSRILRLVKEIKQELNLSTKDTVKISGIDLKSRQATLNFLKEVNAIEYYRTIRYVDGGNDLEVTVTRRHFDQALVALYLNSPEAKQNRLLKNTNKQPVKIVQPIYYDDEHGTVSYQSKSVSLKPEQLEGYLMHRVHRADGARVNAADIASEYDTKHPELDKDVTTKMLTNAKDRVNKKLIAKLELDSEAICYERQQFWLNQQYVSDESPYSAARSGN